MNFIYKILCLLIFLLIINIRAYAQIDGRLLKENNQGYPNVWVFHGKDKTLTDEKGQFTISAKIGDTLRIKGHNHTITNIPFILKINHDTNKIIELKEVVVSDLRWKTENEIILNEKTVKALRGNSNAAIFNKIPGLQVNNMRNEAGALDIGIRGIQGEGRVPIVIDGGIQSTQTFRGYQGSSDRTYIEMDLIKKIEIDKGASFKTNVIGATGGVIEMTTISAEDVVLPENKFGAYLKGSLVNNNKQPNIPEDEKNQTYYIVQNDIKETKFNSGNVTAAVAYIGGKVDFITAISTRNQGNYFAGKNGTDRYGYDSRYYSKYNPDHPNQYQNPPVRPSQEVVNTSYNSISTLTKVSLNIGDFQRIEANYRYHDQRAGEVLAAYWYKFSEDTNPSGVENMPQWTKGTARFYSYGLKYKYNPSSKVNVQLSMYANDGSLKQRNGLVQNPGATEGAQYLHKFKNKRKGATLHNSSYFNFIPLTVKYGVSAQEETMIPQDIPEDRVGSARNGKKEDYSVFLLGSLRWKKLYFQGEIKTHTTKIHDNFDDSNLNYGINTDLISKISYNPLDWLSLHGKTSKIYRSPSLYESTKSIQTISYNDDYPLKPEATSTYEIGFQTRFKNVFVNADMLTFGAGGFSNNSKNYISSAVLDDFSTFSFINYDNYRLKGLDLNMSYKSTRMFINIAAIFYNDFSVCSKILGEEYNTEYCNDSKGFEWEAFQWSLLPSRIPPKQSITVNSGIYAFNKKLTLGGVLRYHSAKGNPSAWLQGTGASGIASNIPADHVIDVYSSYKFNEHFNISLGIDNLTDRYQFDVGTILTMPIPGRTIHIGIEAKL